MRSFNLCATYLKWQADKKTGMNIKMLGFNCILLYVTDLIKIIESDQVRPYFL